MIALHKLTAMSRRLQQYQQEMQIPEDETLTAVIELAELISDMHATEKDLKSFEESIIAGSEVIE